MMKVFKLTDKSYNTYNGTRWGEGVRHDAAPGEMVLCSKTVIHAYATPLLAVFMNPAHADIHNPLLWEAEASDEFITDGLKTGHRWLQTIRIIESPKVSIIQKIAFGILSAKKVCTDPDWNRWACSWLNGTDRSEQSARAAA